EAKHRGVLRYLSGDTVGDGCAAGVCRCRLLPIATIWGQEYQMIDEMKSEWLIVWTAVSTIVAVLLVAIVVMATGAITVGADVKPGPIIRALAPWARDRSVERHAPRAQNPFAGDAAAIAAGMDHYRENCLVCHGAPGVAATEVAKGLNPPAPSLGSEEDDTPDGELFWVT